MTIELKDNGYEKIMDSVQTIEDTAVEGIFPKRASDENTAHKQFQQIISEVKKLRAVILEHVVIGSYAAGPDGPDAA